MEQMADTRRTFKDNVGMTSLFVHINKFLGRYHFWSLKFATIFQISPWSFKSSNQSLKFVK